MGRYTPRRVLARAQREARAWSAARYLRAIRGRTWSSPEQILDAYGRVVKVDWGALGITAALRHLGRRPAYILETGSACYGASSTLVWDAYVRSFGGQCISIDISAGTQQDAERNCSDLTRFICGDSIEVLSRLSRSSPTPEFDLVYLDSLDLDWDNPDPSMAHGLREFELVAPLVRAGGVVLVDDTPGDLSYVPPSNRQVAARFEVAAGKLPGKGALIPGSRSALSLGFETSFWRYALMLERVAH